MGGIDVRDAKHLQLHFLARRVGLAQPATWCSTGTRAMYRSTGIVFLRYAKVIEDVSGTSPSIVVYG